MKRIIRLGMVVSLATMASVGASSPIASSASTKPSPSVSSPLPCKDINPAKKGMHKLTIMVITTEENVADGDKLWQSHQEYMRKSHQDLLITYTLTKGPELQNALNPKSGPTGRTMYVLNEAYKTTQDIFKHWDKTAAEWKDFNNIIAWMTRPGTQVYTLHDGVIQSSLWQQGAC